NGDRVPDIVLEDNGGNMGIWLMSGDTAIKTSLLTPGNVGDVGWKAVDTGDFNKDGHPDILFQTKDGTLAVWEMNGVGLTSAVFTSPSNAGSTAWHAMAVGDFDKDGNPDILFQHTDGSMVIWYMNGVTLTSASPVSPSNPGPGWVPYGVADINADGKPDI